MSSQTQRQTLVGTFFPAGIPRLWCPVVTHFRADGSIDQPRMVQHLEVLASYAGGILIPGSTGEGWDMDDSRVRELLLMALRAARKFDLKMLIGVLRKDLNSMLAVMEGTVSWLCDETGKATGMAAMMASHVAGFTVCPPQGSELSQQQIGDALSAVLELGHPTALYQLPQVTENEMSPECVAHLAADYPNFYLLKDTSGADRVAQAGLDLQGVFLVRGAEGQYHRWCRAAGGPYDGYLLSTANCFAQELAEVMELSAAGQTDDAAHLSQRIENAIEGCFRVVEGFPAANAFTNANKIIDQIMAFGQFALDKPPPYLHGGRQLPLEFVQQAWQILERQQLLPDHGYM